MVACVFLFLTSVVEIIFGFHSVLLVVYGQQRLEWLL